MYGTEISQIFYIQTSHRKMFGPKESCICSGFLVAFFLARSIFHFNRFYPLCNFAFIIDWVSNILYRSNLNEVRLPNANPSYLSKTCLKLNRQVIYNLHDIVLKYPIGIFRHLHGGFNKCQQDICQRLFDIFYIVA